MRILPHLLKRNLLLRTVVGGNIESKRLRGEKKAIIGEDIAHMMKT